MFRILNAVTVAAALSLIFVFSLAHDSSTTVDKAWARETPPTAKSGAAFVTIHSTTGDRLLSVASDAAKTVQLHTHVEENGVMKMTHVMGGIDIPKDGMVMLKPGSFHIMMMGLHGPLKKGAMVPITLTFEHAGDIDVMATVLPIGAKSADGHGTMDHSGHGSDDQ